MCWTAQRQNANPILDTVGRTSSSLISITFSLSFFLRLLLLSCISSLSWVFSFLSVSIKKVNTGSTDSYMLMLPASNEHTNIWVKVKLCLYQWCLVLIQSWWTFFWCHIFNIKMPAILSAHRTFLLMQILKTLFTVFGLFCFISSSTKGLQLHFIVQPCACYSIRIEIGMNMFLIISLKL